MATKTADLLSMVESLPVDVKTELVEKLLDSLHPTNKEIDALWAEEAERRVEELRSGKVKAIPGDEVFKELRKKYSE